MIAHVLVGMRFIASDAIPPASLNDMGKRHRKSKKISYSRSEKNGTGPNAAFYPVALRKMEKLVYRKSW
jgi:hypothetical protein